MRVRAEQPLTSAPARGGDRTASVTGVLSWLGPALLSLALDTATVDRRPLWRDEMATWAFSRLSPADLARSSTHVDLVLAPYYGLMHVWQLMFAAPVALRVPSLLAGAGTVAVTAATAGRLWNSWAALVAGVALAVNGSFVAAATSARPYALSMLCCAVATYLLVRARQDPGRPGDARQDHAARRSWVGYAVALTGAVLCQLLAVCTLAAHGLAALTWFGRDRRAGARFLLAALVVLAVTAALTLGSSGQQDQLLWLHGRSALHSLQTVDGVLGPLRPWHGWPFVAAAVVLAVGTARTRSAIGDTLLALSLVIAPPLCLFAGSVLVRPIFLDRYLLAVPLGAALVTGGAVQTVIAGVARRMPRARPGVAAALTLAAVAAVVIACVPGLRRQFSSSTPDDFPALGRHLAGAVRAGDTIAVGQDYASNGSAAGIAYYSGDRAFARAVVGALPDGSPPLFLRHVVRIRPLTTRPVGAADEPVPPGRIWLLSLVRYWQGEREPYGYRMLTAAGCVPHRDTELRQHGYGLVLLDCPGTVNDR